MPTLATNKKARFEYDILETMEAGLVLSGQETKSVRNGGAKLTGSYVTFHKDVPQLTNAHISKYKYAGTAIDYDPTQTRTLLIRSKEISYLRGKSQEKGLTIVPLSLYTKGRRIKVQLGIARGKKTHNKRETLRRRDLDREASRQAKEFI